MIVKYFYENTDTNYYEYINLWDENLEKMIFLHHRLPLSKQRSSIIDDITDNKEILAIRFPTYRLSLQSIISFKSNHQ